MKNCKSLFLVGILGLLVFPLMASAQNILVNGDFETGDLTGWEVFGGNADASVTIQSPENGPSFPGSNNAFMENTGEALGLTLKQTTAVGSATGGTTYYFLDMKLIDAAVGGVFFVQVFAEQDGVGIVGGSGLQGPFFPPVNEWSVVSGTFEAPATTDFLAIQIMANTGAEVTSTCIVHVDNVYLSQEQPPVATEDMSMGSIKALYR